MSHGLIFSGDVHRMHRLYHKILDAVHVHLATFELESQTGEVI